MRNMKKKIIAMAMAVSLAFATTAFAAQTPVADFTKAFNGASIYGTYEYYDSAKGTISTAEIGFYTADDVITPDYIFVGNMIADGGTHYIRNYKGPLFHMGGNVYFSDDGAISMMLIFGDDGGMSLTVTGDAYNADFAQLNGVYDCVSKLDLAHVS